MAYFLCKEDDEEFVVEADNVELAKETATIYNAVFIRSLTDNEARLYLQGSC